MLVLLVSQSGDWDFHGSYCEENSIQLGAFVTWCKFMDVLVTPVTSILGVEES